MTSLANILFGKRVAIGQLPVKLREVREVRKVITDNQQRWPVSVYDSERDQCELEKFLELCFPGSSISSDQLRMILNGPTSWNCLARHPTTNEIIGFCATGRRVTHNLDNTMTTTGLIKILVVHPERRHKSVGISLHTTALRHLFRNDDTEKVVLSTEYVSLLPSSHFNIAINDSVYFFFKRYNPILTFT